MGTAFYALGHFVNLPDRKSSAMWNSYHPSMILLFALFVVVVEAHETDVTPIGAIFVAVALNLFGYRLGKPTVFIIVTIFSAVFALWVITLFHIDSAFPLSEGALTGVVIAVGASFGVLAVFCSELGVCLLGTGGGGVLTPLIIFVLFRADNYFVLALVFIIFAIPCGLLAVKYPRPAIIPLSAWLGAVIAMQGIRYFAGEGPMSLTHGYYADWVAPSGGYGYILATILLFILGNYIQFKTTTAAQGVIEAASPSLIEGTSTIIQGTSPSAVDYHAVEITTPSESGQKERL